MKVRNIMTKKVITVRENYGIRELCKTLSKNRLSGVPVVDGKGNLVGFVSERDIIGAVASPKFLELTAKDIMTKKVKTLEQDEPLTNASKIFSAEKYRILPVVKGGKVVGVVARKDVIEHMLGNYL